jgi:PAS domain S-box-containing protein
MNEPTGSAARPGRSPATWQQLVDSARDTALISLDLDGRVRTWSAGATHLFGWTAAEMSGQRLDALFDPTAGAGRIEREMAEALRSGRGGGEEGWRVRKDGSRFWAVGELTPIRDDDGEVIGFVKVVRDRTAQRAAEEQRQAETRALEILNRAGSALAQQRDIHQLVQLVADAGVELTGAAFGAFFFNVLDAAGERYMLYTLSGVPRETFARFPMPRNTPLFAPTFTGQGIVRSDDITRDPRYGRNTPHQGMPEGHLPVRSYLAVPVVSRSGEVIGGLFFGHPEAGRFDAGSERGLTGLAAEAAVAIDNVRLDEMRQRELEQRRAAERALRELNATLEQQIEARTRELERTAEAMRQSQKLEALGQLTGGIAHDFNNLLQVIVGNLELIRRTVPPELARIRRAADVAMNSARTGASLTQRLLAFARRQPLDPRPLNINVLVSGMSDMLHRTLGETIDVQTVLGAGLWRVEADAAELENALLNLAVNARDAMPEGGRLTIETANAHLDERYVGPLPDLKPGQYVMVSVTDTGTGMDEETMRQAFEPFFTTKPVGRGTGLGLSQVYGFVTQSSGHVRLYSEPGSGTTVRLYLPRLAGAPEASEEPPQPRVPRSASREKILVVEDDDAVRALSVDSLTELGYAVLQAHDGPSALRLVEEHPDIDLLFTDVVLPGGLNGAQVAASAAAIAPRLKVLFTTGYARNAIVHQGRLDSGVQLLTKPYTFDELARKIESVLQGKPE